jgi:transglutaminase-like putative cysteine protease
MVSIGLSWFSPFVGILYFLASRYCLSLMVIEGSDKDSYKKIAEQIAMFGILIFLPLIFTMGIVSALLIFVVFAQLSLNLQTLEKRQIYVGLMLSFALMTFSASESRNGSFLFLFIPYSLFLCATLFSLQIKHFNLSINAWLKSSGLLLLMSTFVYLIMPRLPALQMGAVPGSDHFYHDQNWVEKAEGISPDQAEDEIQNALNKLKQQVEGLIDDQGYEQGESDNLDTYSNQFSEIQADNLGLKNDYRLNPNVVMYVRSDFPLYLTTKVLDTFNGVGWKQSKNETLYLKSNNGQFVSHGDSSKNNDVLISGYEVDIAEEMNGRIPMAWQPVGLNFPATALKQDAYGSYSVSSTLKSGTSYRAEMGVKWYQGRLFYPKPEEELNVYLELYPNIDERIAELALSVVRGGSSGFQKAVLLEQHLRENYAYTLDTAIHSQGRTPLVEFLFETQYGHCEYFATAMAIMLRTLGIPSRVVNGFSATDINPLTGFIEVRGTDAHAWTEAYIDGVGWMPFEPTAYYQLPQEKQETELTYEQVNNYVDRQVEILRQQEGGFSLQSLLLSTWQGLAAIVSIVVVSLKWAISHYGDMLLATLLLAMLLVMGWRHFKPVWLRYRLKHRISRYRSSCDKADLMFYMTSISEVLELNRLDIRYSTAEDLLAGLVKAGFVDESKAGEFLVCFNQAVYSQQDVHDLNKQVTWLASVVQLLLAHKVVSE